MESDDVLGRGAVVDALVRELVREDASRSSARVVALTGAWGSGKSWLLERVRPRLTSGVVREFNPWLYSDEAALFRGFASLLINGVKDEGGTRSKLAKALEFIGPSVKGFGFDASGMIANAAEALEGFNSPTEIRSKLSEAFGAEVGSTFVFVDDLDRLTPAELVLFFKLVRLVGDVPKIVYLFVYDEDVLVSLLEQTEVAGGSSDRARRYLDKVVEARVSVPRISFSKWYELVVERLAVFGERVAGEPLSGDVRSDLDYRLQMYAYGRSISLRLIERYVAAVEALSPALYGAVNFVDWCLISYVRVVHPAVWQLIADSPEFFAGALRGAPGRIINGKKDDRAKQIAKKVEAIVGDDYDVVDVMALLDSLFPAFAGRHGQGSIATLKASDQHIGDPLFFDRYFTQDLDADDVLDLRVRGVLVALASEADASAIALLVETFLIAPMPTLEAVERRWQPGTPPDGTIAALEKLRRVAGTLPQSISFDPSAVAKVAAGVLRRASVADLHKLEISIAEEFLREIVRESGGYGSKDFTDWVLSRAVP